MPTFFFLCHYDLVASSSTLGSTIRYEAIRADELLCMPRQFDFMVKHTEWMEAKSTDIRTSVKQFGNV
jgi:hypothetical protein